MPAFNLSSLNPADLVPAFSVITPALKMLTICQTTQAHAEFLDMVHKQMDSMEVQCEGYTEASLIQAKEFWKVAEEHCSVLMAFPEVQQVLAYLEAEWGC